MAKLHVRYMVGGRAPGLPDERIYRFQFPERPGALLKFLESLEPQWNISLFHYRNHGADYRPRAGGHPGAAAGQRAPAQGRGSTRSAIPTGTRPTIRPTGCSWQGNSTRRDPA